MKTTKALFGLFTLALSVLPQMGRGQSVLTGPILDPENGYEYYLLTPATWTASEAEAVSLGGNLATVENQAENDWLLNTFRPILGDSGANLWIGLYDPVANDGTGAQHAADFVWASGAPVTYTHWGLDEPNNSSYWGGEYYTILEVVPYSQLVPGDWNDQSNTSSGSFDYGVVEVEAVPEPASVGLLILGGAFFAARRYAKHKS